jgi:hypothetical protein
MSAQANIVLNDGKTTPVAHTFSPKGSQMSGPGKTVSTWKDQSPASAVGYLSLTEQHSAPNANGLEKFRYLIQVPTLEQPAAGGTYVPPPQVAYVVVGSVEVWAPARASSDELKDIVAYVKNFTASTYFADAIIKREHAW